MAKKKSYRRKKQFTIPLGVAAPIGLIASETARDVRDEGWDNALMWLMAKMTGYWKRTDGTASWRLTNMEHGLLPLVMGLAVHKVATRVGLNRAIAGAGIPIIRI